MSDMRVMTKTEWFSSGKYGVMMHFLGSAQESDASWNDRVNAFDCEALAAQLHDCGANHLLFTISQCGGRFCMPIASYDAILKQADYPQALCSDRDLIADLITALDRYGIQLMLYAAVEGPIHGDLKQIFPWDSKGGGPGEGFEEKYFSMLRELSLRYGEKVKGWWIDGCYPHYKGYFDSGNSPYLPSRLTVRGRWQCVAWPPSPARRRPLRGSVPCGHGPEAYGASTPARCGRGCWHG